MESVRYTITLEDRVFLLGLQRKNWQYFVEKMLAITENLTFNIDNEADLERELIDNVLENISEFLHEHFWSLCKFF